jgi:hypothetical protein
MCIQKSKRSANIQIRINEQEREMIDKIKQIDPDFNVSSFMRSKLIEYYNSKFKGIGNLVIA